MARFSPTGYLTTDFTGLPTVVTARRLDDARQRGAPQRSYRQYCGRAAVLLPRALDLRTAERYCALGAHRTDSASWLAYQDCERNLRDAQRHLADLRERVRVADLLRAEALALVPCEPLPDYLYLRYCSDLHLWVLADATTLGGRIIEVARGRFDTLADARDWLARHDFAIDDDSEGMRLVRRSLEVQLARLS